MSRDLAALLDIVDAAGELVEFLGGYNKTTFLGDRKTQAAVLHQLMIIGEAANRLSERTQDTHPDVPWHEVVGMRNRLIHGYDEVDMEEVWLTVTRDIPELIAQLQPLLPGRKS